MTPNWILVADASRARIVSTNEKLTQMLPVKETEHPESRLRSSDLMSDEPGRSWSRPGGIITALDPPSDPAEMEHERFAEELCHDLETGLTEHQFEKLILVAPPRFLGLLRRHVAPGVAERITAEIDRNYTHVSLPDLPGMIRHHLEA